MISEFLSRTSSTQIDEYRGNLENPTRLLKEFIADTRDAVGDRCAIAVRYYMALVIAELLVHAGANVTYVTREGKAGSWSYYTQEQQATQRGLIELGVEIEVSTAVVGFDGNSASLAGVYTARPHSVAADALVLVTSREPRATWDEGLLECGLDAGRIRRIGDCHQPSIIAAAVQAGHKAGRQLGTGQQPHVS